MKESSALYFDTKLDENTVHLNFYLYNELVTLPFDV
jgi:hypothetical protein